ncbi:SPOR domain-containing protein [Roseobacter sp. HKCCD9010]|uniref:SPOR domain-containing protein n=2 Tax=unclassified Roseobacter TaxID=196798 RepID=UPI001A0A7B49|nr:MULTISPECIES: SPOR domain-containing protein [unclassified Roseobacter]MBF9049759.1 SPOR domain-containing protein [Rhodobacterales bacterium HKCCD4356]NNV16536.1 SPOR domain-containing protein [Roseobacter sp. HKCCD8768]NNV30255.1 SPOR domain-containing protein [Roseobacter sp. HKCCD9061]NNV33932.1 SPOR domain-containing protein [Roseobacter sp. HKCCD9073]NNV38182.1 SPOR domain-containing protein [Roseobacter sp. HKCCD9054]NNV46394.1 SPOR domain-containing protein [Roseobacter sp. HKCCD62
MTSRIPMRSGVRGALLLTSFVALAACEDGFQMPFGQGANASEPSVAGSTEAQTPSGATRLVERDVEAPEVFQVTDSGLWDGRPSLGGVWVAHPDATDPERVIIRDTTSDRFVIGALFRRERDNPGPALQVSSDAAAALNLIAGQPTELNVTALRREAEPEPLPEPASEEVATTGAAPESIEAQALDPIAAAAAAIDESETTETVAASAPAPSPAPASAPASNLDRPFIQIGIFSVEENANNTAQALRTAGMVPTIYDQTSNDRRFWRVVVGPSRTRAERDQLLQTVRGLGFQDAYFVTN